MQLSRVRISPGAEPVVAGYADGNLILLGDDPDFADISTLLAAGPAALEKAKAAMATGTVIDADCVEYLSPTTPSVYLGLGYNYKALATNEGVPFNPHPELFAKMPGSAVGHDQPVMVPAVIDKVDYEAELGVVIGKRAARVKAAEALEFVGGYTICNDLTAKVIPRPPESGSVVIPLKAVDTFGPMGPTLITADEIPDPHALTLYCRINGEERQRFSTDDMVHGIPDVIEYITARITLNPGDVITTGTSLGIGIIKVPPVFLDPGDVMEVGIEGYPVLRNRIEWEVD